MKLHHFLIIFAAAFANAGTIVAVRQATATIDPLAIAFLRYGIAALFLLPFINWNECRSLTLKHATLLAAIGFFGLFVSGYFYLIAYQTSCAIDCSLIMATNPIFTLIAAIFFLHEPITFGKAIAFILSLVGAALVIVDGDFSRATITIDWGELLMLGSSLAWVTYNILLKILCRTFSPLFIVFCATVVGTLCFAPFMLNQHIVAPLFMMDAWTFGALIYIVIIATVIGYPLYSYLIKTVGPSMISFSLYSLTPLFLVMLTPFFLKDSTLNIYHIVGGTLIISALALNVYMSSHTNNECTDY